MVAVQSRGEHAPDSRYLASHMRISRESLFTSGGINAVASFLDGFGANCLICVEEKIACWLKDHQHRFHTGLALCLPPRSVIERTLSKELQIETAREVGFNVLPTYRLNGKKGLKGHIPQPQYPLCLRPAAPGRIKPQFKARLVYSVTELRSFLETIESKGATILAQPFMNLPNLVVHGARTVSGASIGLNAFLVERKFEGVTLTIRPTGLPDILRSRCTEFTDRLGLTGNYHFEFLRDLTAGVDYFLEINCRFGGTTAKVFACGYDEPALALQSYGLGNFQPTKIQNRLVSSKQAMAKYLVSVLNGNLSALDYPAEPKFTRLRKAIFGLLACRDDVFSFDDIRGSVALYMATLRGQLRPL